MLRKLMCARTPRRINLLGFGDSLLETFEFYASCRIGFAPLRRSLYRVRKARKALHQQQLMGQWRAFAIFRSGYPGYPALGLFVTSVTFSKNDQISTEWVTNRRKFRSQTFDNMDRWKAEMGRVSEEKRRRKKIKKEKVSEERRSRCAKR